MDTIQKDPFAKAAVQILLRNSFFGVLLCHLPRKPLPPEVFLAAGCPPTAMVDGKHIYYNAEWVQKLTDKERMGLLCHEVLHPALGHLWRRGSREADLFNQACDYVVNGIIKGTSASNGTGYDLPDQPLIDSRFDGMCVEQVYHILKEEQKEQKKQRKSGKVMDGHLEKELGSGKSEKGAGSGGAKGKAEDKKDGKDGKDKKDGKEEKGGKGEKEEKDEKGSGGKDGEETGDGAGKSGQGASSKQQEGTGESEMGESPEESPMDGESMEEHWKGILTQAAMVAKSKGTLPGQLERLINEAARPRVPWQRIIEMYINDVVRDDYDMMKQDRRFIEQGIYFPELQSNACQVAVAVDTSGSIGQAELKTFLGEITGMLRCRGVSKMRLLACDADVTLDEIITPTDPLPENFPGGGGTDFRPVFTAIADQPEGEPPALIVYLTDGYGSFPKQDIGIPTIWLIVTHSHLSDDQLPKAPFGITVRYDLDTEMVAAV